MVEENYTLAMPKVDKTQFDALLIRLLRAKLAPKSTIETSRKTKAGKVIPNPQPGN